MSRVNEPLKPNGISLGYLTNEEHIPCLATMFQPFVLEKKEVKRG